MPQTLLAVFAIFGVSLLALQGARGRIADLQDTYQSGAEVQARGVGVEVLERISGVPFDGGEGGTAGGTGTDAYSPPASFGTGVDSDGQPLGTLFTIGAFDDLDDFDGVQGAVATVTVFDPVSATAQTIEVEVSIEVDYVADAGGGDWRPVGGTTRTPFKRALVTLAHPSFPTPAQLGRIYVAP